MAVDCCCLTGNFEINLDGCIISLNTSSKAQFTQLCDTDVIIGPVVGNLSMTAYASNQLHRGCPASAGVSIPWLSKFDCDNDVIYYVFGGEGTSFTTGEVSSYASKNYSANVSYYSVSANAGAGPATFCQQVCREEGYGLTYDGDPISFNTSTESTMIITAGSILSGLGAVGDNIYLQSFNLDLAPGNLPVVTYNFLFTVGESVC